MEQCRFDWLSNCSANKGLNLVKFDVTINRDSVTVDAGTVDDNPTNSPKFGTTATDKYTFYSESFDSEPDAILALKDIMFINNTFWN